MNSNIKTLTRAAVLLALALVFQIVKIGGQYLTGSGINAVLIIAASICGVTYAVAIGSLTPLFALWLGVLKQPVIVILPFIIAGNILYVAMYSLVKKYNRYVAVVLAALLKFALLYTTVNYLVKVPEPIKIAMSLPQLITALIGGALALVVIKLIPELKKS